MADESYIDNDGVSRTSRRTGDPWRRAVYGEILRLKDRQSDTDTRMTAFQIRQDQSAASLHRLERAQEQNNEMTERVDKATAQLVSIANKVFSTHDVLKWFGKTFVLWGTIMSMLITAGWIIMTGHPPWK